MLIIEIKKGETIESALKKLKSKFKKTGILTELRENTYFEKPSNEKRYTKKKAIYVQKKFKNQED